MEPVKRKKKKPVRALLVIDVQNDFIDGNLAVPDAKSILPVINRLRSKKFDYTYICLDWHPFNHCSFRTNNPGSDLFQVLYLPNTGDAQRMWPDHCVQGSHGAEIHQDLILESTDVWTYAGCNPRRDSYSVFKDNNSKDLTDMVQSLRDLGVTEIYALGLATDFCVQYTVLDAKIYQTNADVFVIEDGCRGLSEEGVKRAMKSFEFEKVKIISSNGREIAAIEDRKLALNGSLQLLRSRRDHSAVVCDQVDDLYEHVLLGAPLDKAALKRIVKAGKINHRCSWSGRNLLHVCCERADSSTLAVLFEVAKSKLDLTALSKKGENALMIAVQSTVRNRRRKVARMLLNFAQPAEQSTLLKAQSLDHQMTALMFACREADLDMVEELLRIESSDKLLSLRSKFGKTAIMFASMKDTPEAAAIVEHLLRTQPPGQSRLELVCATDSESWNLLHFGGKSGCLSKVNWARALGGEEFIPALPINELTSDGQGFTVLHLAAFNGKDEVIRTIVDLSQLGAEGRESSLQCTVNVAVRSTGDTELDLALKRGHIESARLLLRLGCHASTCSKKMQELLHRLVLMGDVEACESVLDYADENQISIDEGLVVLTQRMESPEACTFSFANYTHPVPQYLYYCEYCSTWVCLVCKDRCHGKDTCRSHFTKLDLEHYPGKGWKSKKFDVSYCECPRETCCASSVLEDREKEARTFTPRPIQTSHVYLDGPLIHLSKALARNTHNVWAQEKHKGGWMFSRNRDDSNKKHPLLLPFDALSPEATKYNMDIAVETIKVIKALGYELILQTRQSFSSGSSMDIMSPQSPGSLARHQTLRIRDEQEGSFAEIAWQPSNPSCNPLDTSRVKLPPELDDLVECIAKNSHEVWALEKVRKGWRYAPARNIKVGLKLNKSLVPFASLDIQEKANLRHGAIETIKAILSYGWAIQKASDGDPEGMKRRLERLLPPHETLTLSEACHNLLETRRELFNQYLFAAARLKQTNSIDILISKHQHGLYVGANLNARDRFGHTALYIAIKRGHFPIVNRLLGLSVDINTRDVNGLTPLALAAYLGNLPICEELVHHDADILSTDNLGFTPLHHAAYRGNLHVCAFLIECLQIRFQSNSIANLNAYYLRTHSLASNNQVSITPKPDGQNPSAPLAPSQSMSAWLWSFLGMPKGKGEATKITPLPRRNQGPVSIKTGNFVAGLETGHTNNETNSKDDSDEDSDLDGDDLEMEHPQRQLSVYSPLTMAVFANQLHCVELLINRGADPMLTDRTSDRHSKVSPYIRSLLLHIEFAKQVHKIQEELSLQVLHENSASSSTGNRGNFFHAEFWRRRPHEASNLVRHNQRLNLHSALAVASQFARRPSFSKLMARDKEIKKSTQKLNKELEAAQENLRMASKMVEVLNKSRNVRKWRRRKAMEQFARETTILLFMVGVFFGSVQLAPDYDLSSEQQWKAELRTFIEARVEGIVSEEQFLTWLHDDLFPSCFALDEGMLTFLRYNYVLGSVLVEWSERHLRPQSALIGMKEDDLQHWKDSLVQRQLLVKPSTPSEMASFVRGNLSAANDADLRLSNLALEINTFNPFSSLYGIVSVELQTSYYAEARVNIQLRTFRLNYSRFPPSREFQVAVSVIIAVFIGARFHRWFRRKWTGGGYPVTLWKSRTQWMTVVVLVLILILDLILYSLSRPISADYHMTDYQDLKTVHRMLEMERRLFGFFFFLSMIPVLNAARTIPNVGPVVVALLNTITHLAVLIYLVVVAAACFLMALTFHVSFGAEVQEWGSLTATFNDLFHTPFIETWDSSRGIFFESNSGMVLSVVYILFATVAVNLLIAVVTDVYPKERKASDSLWETIVTQGIENSLRYKKYKRLKDRGHDDDADDELYIDYWDASVLLLGKDGIKYWTPPITSHDNSCEPLSTNVAHRHHSEDASSSNNRRSQPYPTKRNPDASSNVYPGEYLDMCGVLPTSRGEPETLSSGSRSSPASSSSPAIEARLSSLEVKLDKLLSTMAAGLLSQQAGVLEPPRSSSSSHSNGVIHVGDSTYSADPPGAEDPHAANVSSSHAEHLREDMQANAAHVERANEVKAAKVLLSELVADGPCPLQRVKELCKKNKPPISWETAKRVRRELGIVQCKDMVKIDGKLQVVRFWRSGTEEELDFISKK